MNPDDQQPGQGTTPNNLDQNTPPTTNPQPSAMPQPPVDPMPTTPSASPTPGAMPAPDQQAPASPLPGDDTPGVTPVSPTNDGAYGQGTMQPEVPPTMPAASPKSPMDRRKTGLILLAVVIVALAVVAWLMTQAFSG